jgi:hypothetical protein
LDISNPLLKGNRILVEYRLLLSDLFKAFLFLDFKSVKLVFNKFITLIKLKEKEVLKNRKISEKEGMSFLQ